jgi:hypothetical protein
MSSTERLWHEEIEIFLECDIEAYSEDKGEEMEEERLEGLESQQSPSQQQQQNNSYNSNNHDQPQSGI